MAAIPNTPALFVQLLRDLRQVRRERKSAQRPLGLKRKALSATERKTILGKTGGRCHVCGGVISGPWHADHVFPHSGGGEHETDNYLPAHALCNNYRWDYTAEEFQQILKLGVWIRTQIERETSIGLRVAVQYVAHESRRQSRQRKRI